MSQSSKSWTLLAIPLLALLITSSGYYAYQNIKDISPNLYNVPKDWENGLYDEISFLNANANDSSGIISVYALPLGYFTDHVVIDLYKPFGVVRLLSVSGSSMGEFRRSLLTKGVDYLLLPREKNTYFGYFENITVHFPYLSLANIEKTPSIVLLRSSEKWMLFKILSDSELDQYYESILYPAGRNPRSLNNNSAFELSNDGIILTAQRQSTYNFAQVGQENFWSAVGRAKSDTIIVNASADGGSKQASMRIQLNSSYAVLRHSYNTSQDWSAYDSVTFDFCGARSNKTIQITFQTVRKQTWQDLFEITLRDSFIGCRTLELPFNSFHPFGNPSWSQIDYIEIVFRDTTAVYYLSPLQLRSNLVGIQWPVSRIDNNNSSYVQFALSLNDTNLSDRPAFEVKSRNQTFIFELNNGVNIVHVPSLFLSNDTIITISFRETAYAEYLRVYYVAILR